MVYQAVFKVLSMTSWSLANKEWCWIVNCLHGLILNQAFHKGLYDLLLLLIYKNDLSEGLTTNSRLSADYVSLFSVVNNINLSANNLNCDLSKINASANQWEMTRAPLVTICVLCKTASRLRRHFIRPNV